MLRCSQIWCAAAICGLVIGAGQTASAAPKAHKAAKPSKQTQRASTGRNDYCAAPDIPADEAYRQVLVWASGKTNPQYLNALYDKMERSAYRYGILPEFAMAVVSAEAKYGRGISFARQDSWRMYETSTGKPLKAYPNVLDDMDTSLSELRQIMASSGSVDEVFKQYWCGPQGKTNTDSYGSFAEAAAKLWNGLEPYARQRAQAENPDKYRADFSNEGKGYGSSWGGLADGDMDGYRSKMGSRPDLASQLKPFPGIEDAYAGVAQYYNKRLTHSESIVIARAVLTFSAQTKGGKGEVDPRLVMALLTAESRFRPDAVSNVGALGLGQLMPATARGLGVGNPLDPVQNIWGCVKYLERESYRWGSNDNSMDLILASYNAGAGAVQRFHGVPPYNETRSYVKIVKANYHTFSRH